MGFQDKNTPGTSLQEYYDYSADGLSPLLIQKNCIFKVRFPRVIHHLKYEKLASLLPWPIHPCYGMQGGWDEIRNP